MLQSELADDNHGTCGRSDRRCCRRLQDTTAGVFIELQDTTAGVFIELQDTTAGVFIELQDTGTIVICLWLYYVVFLWFKNGISLVQKRYFFGSKTVRSPVDRFREWGQWLVSSLEPLQHLNY